MKMFFLFSAMLITDYLFAQSPEESRVLKLSADIFHWEITNKMDKLDSVFADQFVVVNAAGESQTKLQYLARLRSGNFAHDSIDIEQNTAAIIDNTATVVGKGRFVVRSSGKQLTLRLSYIEVFTRPNETANWKIMAMHASVLPN